ncbi:MAG TPA: hypothetical protein VG096_08330 [Bryobacteraceae bacterium]|jgi:uncharacterized repeat protein (TIGR01451 family)|nr:hypothetical protein [Bryobacteraceae bacterium]
MSKTFSGALLLILAVAAVSASAQTTFTVNVTFSDGDTLSGTFTSTSPYTSNPTSWNVQVTGPTAGHDFSSSTGSGAAIVQTPANPAGCGGVSDAQELTFASPGFTVYSTLCLSTALSSTGATLDLPNTLDCDGTCGTATAGSISANVAPTFIKAFDVNVITVGQTTRLGFAIVNPTGNTALTGLAFTDTLPGDLLVAPGTVLNTCGGTLTAVPGTNSVSYTGGSIAAGLVTCNVIINVTPVAPVSAATSFTNTTSTLTSHQAPTAAPASASILVIPADAALISYSANLKAGDSKINLTNAGTDGGNDATDSLCANVYVFAEDQQLIECCTCPLTPNHLSTLSAQNDLISNTLTPGVPIGITTMLVASTGACNAAAVAPANLVGGLRAWGTTLHAAPGGGFAVTETHFRKAALSPTELAKMTSFCGFIQANGSKFGVCNACQDGAAGAQKQ